MRKPTCLNSIAPRGGEGISAGFAGATMRGLDGQKLGDPPRRTGSGGDFVPNLRQFAERSRAKHGEKHELRQKSPAHAPRQHVAGAEPQHEHDAAESERNRNRNEEGTGGGSVARRAIGAFDFFAETRLTGALGAEGLHGARRAQTLRSEGGRFGKRILSAPRPSAHHPTGSDQRRGDERNGDQHQRRQFGARVDHQRGGADEHEQIAQSDRGRRAESRLDLRRVGGETRNQFARPRAVVERGVETRQMREHIAAEIGDHPLAQRCHEIIPRGRGQGDDDHQGSHGEKIDIDRAAALFREAEIDHRTQRERHRERRGGGDCQRRQRRARAAEIAPAIANKRKQRRHGCCSVCRLSRHPLIH